MTTLKQYELAHPALSPITSDAQLDEYTRVLTDLEERQKITRLAPDDRKYAQVLALLIEKYEATHYPAEPVSPLEVLTELINANGLRQKDLAPILGGHESAVSEILHGKRPLSKSHIEALSRRFKVSPAVFFAQAEERRQQGRTRSHRS